MKTATASLIYRDLQNSLKLAGMTQVEIARKAKIHQSQVSRIMSGQFKRVSAQSLIKLCELARIEMANKKSLSAKLQNALSGAWDGSRSHEDGLVNLLKAVDALTLGRLAGKHGATDRKRAK